jgi:alpha-galactosidase
MLNLERKPDVIEVETDEGKTGDAVVRFAKTDFGLEIYLRASSVHPRFVKMRWNTPLPEGTLAFGDQFERLQGNAHFGPLSADRYFAWYFALVEPDLVECGGVRVRPHSFVTFSIDQMGINAYFDVRCGGVGVALGSRELPLACLLSSSYPHSDAMVALKQFCQRMCPDGIFPNEPVYGGNDWYFAYGKSSSSIILENTKMIAELAEGNTHRPFMIIDDGWEQGACGGPWLPNAHFGAMDALVNAINEQGVKAGLWIRFLANNPLLAAHPGWGLSRIDELGMKHLDPSLPEVLDEIRTEIRQVKAWGFRLIKHDYSVHDMFGYFGYDIHGNVSPDEGWSFHDRSRTGAEICLDLYRTIKEECGKDCLVMGCDVFSHLTAGYCEINRIGDDTSGENWDRTRAFGVNALAFRSVQNGVFYSADADCVGYGKLSFEKNKPWLDLVSHSGTPLFISGRPSSFSSQDKKSLKEAFARAAKQSDTAVPLDYLSNVHPARWKINGKEVVFDWQAGEIPNLILAGEVQPLHLAK